MSGPGRRARAAGILKILAIEYPDAECALDFESPWQLLVATVLSAQCTDQRVNSVTPELFRRWPDANALAKATIAELEETIRSIGFFRNKARSLIDASRILVAEHGGSVPATLDELVRLPGVGRKTAKVVLGEAFGIAAGITVDTHVKRLARRFGLTELTDAEMVAGDLEDIVPQDQWIIFSQRVIHHGRRVCLARRPQCEGCVLLNACMQRGV